MRKNLFFKHCFAFLSGLITSLQEKMVGVVLIVRKTSLKLKRLQVSEKLSPLR